VGKEASKGQDSRASATSSPATLQLKDESQTRMEIEGDEEESEA
jgi:hypothetical protein